MPDIKIDISRDEITIDGVVYDIEREDDRGHPETTLKVRDFDVEADDWIYPFDGLEATLGYEEYAEDLNPRSNYSNVGMMFCDYRGYNLGDEDAADPRDQTTECPDCDGSGEIEGLTEIPGEADTCARCEGLGEIDLDMAEYLRKEHGARVVMPLYVYEHSGITMRAGAPVRTNVTKDDVRSSGRFVGDDAGWDTSMVGFIYDTPEQVKECIGEDATDEQIEACLKGEVQTYASYLEGDIAYYSIYDTETDYTDGCTGFIGDSDGCEQQCFEGLAQAIVKRLDEIKERAEMAARDIITI